MKKNYVNPQAEKIEFNYAEMVVASNSLINEEDTEEPVISVCTRQNDQGQGKGCSKNPVYNDSPV